LTVQQGNWRQHSRTTAFPWPTGDGRLHLLTKAIAFGWVGIGGVIGAAYGGIGGAAAPAASLVNYNGGFVSPVSVLGGITVLWLLIDWRVARARRERENAAILRDKPGLKSNPKALARERRIREKELKLQKREMKAMRAENRAEKRIAKDGRKENSLEHKRETIAMQKERLRERQNLGR